MIEGLVEPITIGAVLGAIHAPVAVVTGSVVVDVGEGHCVDVEKMEKRLRSC